MVEIINIAVIEPSSIIREGLKHILMKSKNHFYVHSYENFGEFFTENLQLKPQIIILNPNFIYTIKSELINLRRNNPSTYLIGLIYSYFDKEFLAILDATIQITDNTDVIENLIDIILKSQASNHNVFQQEQLSSREKDVLIHLVHGLSNKEIANKLFISVHTVITHRKNIALKTGIKSQSGLTIYAISNKIISIDNLSLNI